MAEGRWLDDAYSGAERPQGLGPRFLPAFYRYLRWTWPLPVVALFFLPASWGWLFAGFVWLASSYPFYRHDVRIYNAAVAEFNQRQGQ